MKTTKTEKPAAFQRAKVFATQLSIVQAIKILQMIVDFLRIFFFFSFPVEGGVDGLQQVLKPISRTL